jgi:hypothetical protein
VNFDAQSACPILEIWLKLGWAVGVLQHPSMVSLKFRYAVQDAHDDVPNTLKDFSWGAAGHRTVLDLAWKSQRLEAGNVGWKTANESVGYARQNSTQFL